MATYFINVKPEPGKRLRELLKDCHENRIRVRMILEELNGIGEIDKGITRQMVLTTPELRIVKGINTKYNLGIVIGDV